MRVEKKRSEVSDDERFRQMVRAYLLTTLLVAASATTFAIVTQVKVRGQGWLARNYKGEKWLADSYAIGLSILASTGIGSFNFAIKKFTYEATRRERHTTWTAFERSLFSKLSLACAANPCLPSWSSPPG